jgi:predicted MFS family arabinose efflux permease
VSDRSAGAAPGVTEPPDAPAAAPPFSDAYARYVLGLLFVAYVFNFIDRQILAILLEPIKRELGASDTAMGLLTGFAFALFYTFAGIPIARLADRSVRRSIIAAGLAVWSVMTAASGMVRSFAELALARIGVGVGEAAFVPPAHSLISDYFPPERRATAMAVFSMGVHVGIAFGFLLGGWIAEFFGWRRALFAVGLPGLLLAVLVRLTVREPPRRTVSALGVPAESARTVVLALWRRRSFRHLSLAAALHSFGGYAFAVWGSPYFVRVHGMSSGELGTWLGSILGLGGALGSVGGGLIADRWGAADARRKLYLPAIASVLQVPWVLLVLVIPNPRSAMLALIPSAILSAMWFGPVFALTQSLVRPEARATAAAVLVFVINLIGLGLGPPAIGALSDALTPSYGPRAIGQALLVIGVTNLWAAAHFYSAARTVRADLADAAR